MNEEENANILKSSWSPGGPGVPSYEFITEKAKVSLGDLKCFRNWHEMGQRFL